MLCSNIFKWGQGMASFDPLLVDDYMDEVRVTTIFLGMDNSNSDGPPLLFETIITGGWLDQFHTLHDLRGSRNYAPDGFIDGQERTGE